MNHILSDNTKFEKAKLKKNDTKSKVNKCISEFKNLNVFSGTTLSKLYPHGDVIPKLYGLPKIHKHNMPLRPILAMVGSPTHGLAKWLADILKPVEAIISDRCIGDSFSFVEKVRSMDLSNKVIGSLDISSLFTQVPVEETVNMILDIINENMIDLGIPTDLLKKAILLCVKDVLFKFNGQIYIQKDGVGMGSPLGPRLANIFVGYLEHKFKNEINERCNEYLRYVDDTFVVCSSISEIENFQVFMNSLHPDLKFTIEVEKNRQLPFSDVLVMRSPTSDQITKTKIFRKSTWNGQYLHFHSCVPIHYKSGLVKTLFHRARKICSKDFLAEEEQFLTNSLTRNGYPKEFILKYSTARDPVFGPKGKRMIIELPFFGDQIAKKYENKLKCISRQVYTVVEPKIIWKCRSIPQRSLKDERVESEKCGIIYEFKCSCSSTYLGRTSRSLGDRIKEHVPAWLKNGKKQPPRSTIVQSSIAQHLLNCNAINVAAAEHHFRKVHTDVHPNKAHILEALLIASRSPDLCRQKDYVYRLLLPW